MFRFLTFFPVFFFFLTALVQPCTGKDNDFIETEKKLAVFVYETVKGNMLIQGNTFMANNIAACIDWENSHKDDVLVNASESSSDGNEMTALNACRKWETPRHCSCQTIRKNQTLFMKIPEKYKNRFK